MAFPHTKFSTRFLPWKPGFSVKNPVSKAETGLTDRISMRHRFFATDSAGPRFSPMRTVVVVASFQLHFEAQEPQQVFEAYDADKLIVLRNEQTARAGALHLAQGL